MRYPLLLLLFLLSGAAGLVYELVWVRELIFVFGGTTYAITTVLVAFMGGLGLGSFLSGRVAGRLTRPGRTYGLLEIGIGLYGIGVPLLLHQMVPIYRAFYAPLNDWPIALALVRFALSAVVLVIPTILMGATLPILVRYVTGAGGPLGRAVGTLYGINTLGAVLGTLLAGFWLIPTFGLTMTTRLAAASNLSIGLLGLLLLARALPRHADAGRPAPVRQPPDALRPWLLAGFAVSGFAAMVYQLTWTRALIMSVGSSTYAYTCILAAFILGLALGSLVVARWADRWDAVWVFGLAELLIGLGAVLIVPLLGQVPLLVRPLVKAHSAEYGTLLGWQFALIVAITFVPTFLMGAIFPLVTRALAHGREEQAAAATGRAYAINTLGTIAGAFVAGFVLIRSDMLGVQKSIVLASVLNGLVGTGLLLGRRPQARTMKSVAIPVAALLLILAVGLGSGRWDTQVTTTAPFLNRPQTSARDRQIVYYAEGVDLTVAVEHRANDPDGLTLTVNGKPDAAVGYDDMVTQLLLGHLPALMSPPGQSACVIGLGSGMTLAAIARHPSYQQLDCAEISAEVIDAARLHFAPFCYNVLDDPRVRIKPADGRNHLLLTDRTYDLIVSEPSNPWMTGVSNLFTREFFQLAHDRLREQGRLAVWLHTYSMSVQDFQMIVRTLFDVFDSVSLWELNATNYLILAGRTPLHVDPADCQRRFEEPAVQSDLYRIAVRSSSQVLGNYIAADAPLRAWCASAPVHTDDNARLEFSAPRYLYVGQQDELVQQFVALQRPPDEFLTPAPEPNVKRAIEDVAVARVDRAKALLALTQRDLVGTLGLLLDSYRRCPFNSDVYLDLTLVRQAFIANPQLAGRPGVAAQVAQIDRLRPPRLGPRRGISLPEMAADLRKEAEAAGQRGDWLQAAATLTDARQLQPRDRDLAVALGDALEKAGRPQDAAQVRAALTAPPTSEPAGSAAPAPTSQGERSQ